MKSEVEHTLLPHALPQDLRGPLPFQALDITILLFNYFFIPIPKLKLQVISADDVSLKGKSTRDIYWNAIIAVTHIYRFSPMGFLGWGYRLQMLTHLSLSHPPTFSLTHTPQPLYSHNTVIDLVKGPRFIFLCTGDVSIENTSCVWGRKLARQHRMLYAADTMGRWSQWHPAEPVAHNSGITASGT